MRLIITSVLVFLSIWAFGADYYINSEIGSDMNSGLSKSLPFKSLEKVNKLKLKPGDKILFSGGSEFKGSLILEGVSGTEDAPISIGSYPDKSDKLPFINAKGYRNGILVNNCSHITIQNLNIKANGGGIVDGAIVKNDMRCGIFVTTSKAGNYKGIKIKNVEINDIYFEDPGYTRGANEVKTANGTQRYGWGIRFINRTEGAFIEDVLIENCKVQDVAHTGIKFTTPRGGIKNVKLYDNKVKHTGGPGMQMSGVVNGHVKGNTVHHSGSITDTRKWSRGSGLWTWGCNDIIIEHNEFKYANGPADSAGCHIDFNCKNVIVQYNLSVGNAGGFCEILGNNYNCAYRYNISVNDGHRTKGENGAFQEGKIFWLSGFVGKNQKRNGPFNSYFYNNTIYVKNEQIAKIAVDRASKGAFVANNIFYVMGGSKAVLGDQYQPEKKGEMLIENVVFKNNLFLMKSSWPEGAYIYDTKPVYGDPKFKNAGGEKLEDYIPTDMGMIKNKGIEIIKIPGDEIGLIVGLKAEKDILGNKIIGKPDFGAIEIN